MIHVARRLLENLRADRRRPPLARLEQEEDCERFVWSILPHAARTFSFCIAVLPRRTARALAAAYLYCRMLDTCEDLAGDAAAKEAALRAFRERFAVPAGAGFAPPPALPGSHARDDRDRVHLLLLRHAARVDRFFATLPEAQRAVVLRLVERMGLGMEWAVRTFAAQGGTLRDDAQLSDYCIAVLGNPMRFAEEMQRLERGLPAAVPAEREPLARAVGEAIQLANVARDLEKDAAAGVWYLPELAARGADPGPDACAAARTRLLARALACGRAFAPYMRGIPSPRLSLARGAGLLMALFTLAFWQGTAARLDRPLGGPRDRITPARSAWLVLRAVMSRAGFEAILQRLDRIFAEGAARLAADAPAPPRRGAP